MIEIKNLTKSFDDSLIFKDFNLVINDGDFLCVGGDSGSGKTTLLNMIGLLEPYDKGKILFNKKEIKTKKERIQMFRRELGFVFQDFLLVNEKTVEENLNLIRPEDRTYDDMDEILEKLGIRHSKNKEVYKLSGGEQQRVALARLYLKKCRYILADEPTGSLDKNNAKKVLDIFHDLNINKGKTFIIVSHDDMVKKASERVVDLNEMDYKA